MLFNNLSGKIYVSIASLMDLELEPTIKDLISKSKQPESLFISVYSQDDNHPDLETIFEEYGVSYKYNKVHHSLARGVGHARHITQKYLTEEYRYLLQVDSHMRFVQNWDKKLIQDYEKYVGEYGDLILSTYPPAYELDENLNETYIDNDGIAPIVALVKDEELPFEAKYIDRSESVYGDETGYFCAGFAFGYSKYFSQVPPDLKIYFWGEEHTTSIRFFKENIKIVAPGRIYCYHDYDGNRRKRHWELAEASITKELESKILVRRILAGDVPSILHKDIIKEFMRIYVT